MERQRASFVATRSDALNHLRDKHKEICLREEVVSKTKMSEVMKKMWIHYVRSGRL